MGRIEKMDLFSHSTELAYTVSKVILVLLLLLVPCLA